MTYAPIIIPTLNRIEHLTRCIESLRKNRLADKTDLYIALDYPPSQKYEEGYEKVKAYLENGISGFASVNIVYREKNYGPLDNGLKLQKELWERYDRSIYTEDDNVFAPCFLEYMNEALEKYKDNKDILAVYSYGPRVKNKPQNGKDVYITNYFSAYGCGQWRDKEKQLSKELNYSYIENLSCDKQKLRRMRHIHPETICYLASILLRKEPIYRTEDGRVQLIDTVKITYAVAENKYLLCSPKRMVVNRGYDGSGAHCNTKDVTFDESQLVKEENCDIGFPDVPETEELDYGLKKGRIIPFCSAYIRIMIWRLIANRRGF